MHLGKQINRVGSKAVCWEAQQLLIWMVNGSLERAVSHHLA